MREKILLIYPPYVKQAFSSFAPLGIAQLAAYIRSRNPNVYLKVLDFTAEKFSSERLKQALNAFEPEVLGISLLTLNAPAGMLIAEIAKQHNPDLLIVMGGVHATMFSEECLKVCDIVVRGEGEETLYELLQGRPLDAVEGISFKKNGIIIHNRDRAFIPNLNDLPMSAHDLFNFKHYECYPTWGISGSRGCPYRCIFCSSPIMWKRQLRLRTPENITDEIEYMRKSFGITSIMFFDDTINIPQSRAIAICDYIIARGLNKTMSFACQMRANSPYVSSKLFTKMRQANFCRVEFGIESGSQRVLDSIHKSLTVHEAKEAVKLAKDAGIPIVKGFFLIGSWDETLIDVFRTWRLILSVPVYPVFSISTPFPGTDLYNMCAEKGYVKGHFDWRFFNQNTSVARTNKMSKGMILLAWVGSFLLFEVILTLTRGRSLSTVMHTLIRNVRVKLGLIKIRSEIGKMESFSLESH